MRWTLAVCLAALLCLATVPATAVLLAPGDGTQNTTAPADDPGWANLGYRSGPGLSAIYLGNRWVVTASHVGAGTVTFNGVPYAPIAGTTIGFETAPGQLADLIVFKLRDDPGLPSLAITTTAPAVGTSIVMMGYGRNRGAATQWSGIDGWLWGASSAKRWGTNRIAAAPTTVTIGPNTSRAFWTDFSLSPPPQVTTHEAQAALGDSGGGLFVDQGANWALGGLIFAIGTYGGQPANTSLHGNLTYAIDLAFYRSAILSITTQPACDDGIEDDGDGLVDFPADPGCASATDLDERSPLLVCDDGADNDGDGLKDYPADPGCRDPAWTLENPQCDDDLDNEGDGRIDWDGGASNATPDPYCVNNGSYRDRESPPSNCGFGAELAVLIPLLARFRRRVLLARDRH